MNAADERAIVLRERLRDAGLLNADVAARLEVPWRHHRIVAYLVFFVLTALGAGAFYWFCDVLDFQYPGVITAVVAIAIAEALIHGARWFHTGVEAALWLCGLFAAITDLPSSGEPEALLVIAGVCAVAGLRVRNPLFGAVAAAVVAHYFERRFDLGVVAALVIAAAAMFALLRRWRRPTTEWLLIAIVLLLPVTGWVDADEMWRSTTIALYATLAVLAFAMAIARRHHAFFFAAMIATAIASTELGKVLHTIPLEARLAFGGATLLAASFAIHRLLRNRTEGIVVTPRRESEALAILATLATQPAHDAPAETQKSGGGEFGGAGASGSY